ncbi:MAG: hypothetical protein O3A00_16070 [Planctomycetota bacterium]|nr:hypothetical protein [Planctomycetota bacterium]
MPDGLLEVRFHGETHYTPLLLEVATYPERRVQQQVTLDGLLVFADEWSEMVVLVLSPKGNSRRATASQSARDVFLFDQVASCGALETVCRRPLGDGRHRPHPMSKRCDIAIPTSVPISEAMIGYHLPNLEPRNRPRAA